jgi:hypothetical protein
MNSTTRVALATLSTNAAGLGECLPPELVVLADGDRFNLRIAPVAK